MSLNALAFVVVLPTMVGAFFYSRLPRFVRPLVWLSAAAVVTEIFAFIMGKYFHNSIPLYYAYCLVLASTLGSFFYRIHGKRWMPAVTLVVMVAPVAELTYLGFGSFPSYSVTLIDLAAIAGAVYTMYAIAVLHINIRALNVSGYVLCYFMGGFIYFTLGRYLPGRNMDLMLALAWMWAAVNLICNLALTYSLWKLSRYSSFAA